MGYGALDIWETKVSSIFWYLREIADLSEEGKILG